MLSPMLCLPIKGQIFLKVIGKDFCNALVDGVATSNGPKILAYRGVRNFRHASKDNTFYLFKKMPGLEECFDDVFPYNIPHLLEE